MPAKQHRTDSPFLNGFSSQPYPVTLLHHPPWQQFTKQNGYISLAQSLSLQVVSDPRRLKDLWQAFSPDTSAFHLWEIRKSFFDGYDFEPYFLTIFRKIKRKTSLLGILPLSIDDDKLPPKYIWFGSNWPEDNVFFVQDPELIPLLLFASPNSLRIDCITPLPEYEFLLPVHGFSKDKEKKFFLDLSSLRTIDDFLIRLKKKKRYNLRRDRKRIQSLRPNIIVNNSDHLEKLFALSIERFRQKYPDNPLEYSTFESERQKAAFRNILHHKGRYDVRILSTVINGEISAVEFGIVYNKTYHALNAGAGIAAHPGIGVFSTLLVLEDALRLGCTKIDFLEDDNNWKNSWQLDHIFQYQFSK